MADIHQMTFLSSLRSAFRILGQPVLQWPELSAPEGAELSGID